MSYIGNSLPANFQSLPAVQRFNGTGSATAFTLAAQIANDQSILVSVDGVTQDSNAYSVSGTTLTFTAAPSSGTGNIFVNTISPVGSTVVPPDGSVTTARIVDEAVTKVKTDFYISQATAPSSPAEGDIWFNSSASTVSGIDSKAMASYSGTAWYQMSNTFTGTGGTESTYDAGGVSYKVHTFTSSGTFTTTGLTQVVDFLIVAGGGGGGNCNTGAQGGGGGGAGGFLTSSGTSGANSSALSQLTLTPGAYTVTIGAGGAGGSFSEDQIGAQGTNSTFGGLTAIGGGGGGANSTEGTTGGSGGGGKESDGVGRSGTSNQGMAGGNGSEADDKGGGGGGAGQTGRDHDVSEGAGGAGLANSIRTGSAITYAGGGGAGGAGSAAGGAGGGGAGGVAGTANTGGGGGADVGTSSGTAAKAGGSGIVIVRYVT